MSSPYSPTFLGGVETGVSVAATAILCYHGGMEHTEKVQQLLENNRRVSYLIEKLFVDSIIWKQKQDEVIEAKTSIDRIVRELYENDITVTQIMKASCLTRGQVRAILGL